MSYGSGIHWNIEGGPTLWKDYRKVNYEIKVNNNKGIKFNSDDNIKILNEIEIIE